MKIECVCNSEELKKVLFFVKDIFSKIIDLPENIYTYDFWLKKVDEKSNLLLYAMDNNEIIASVFAWTADGDGVTIGHFCVNSDYRNKGIGKEMMDEIEKRIKKSGGKLITLGAVETAEGFYEKMGYTGSLLIQAEKYSIDDLLSLNKKYKVLWTNIYDNKINQICLSLPKTDRTLQKRYEETFLGCNTQMIFQKVLL
jgi:GNAT superfamily N-acetyltransferase